MSFNREIQDFLGAFGAVDRIATNMSKRDWYRQKAQGPNSPTNANSPAGGWVAGQAGPPPPGVQTQAPYSGGLLHRAGQWAGRQFGGQPAAASIGGALSPAAGYSPPAYDPNDQPDFSQTYADGGDVLPPDVPQVTTDTPPPPQRDTPQGGAVPLGDSGGGANGGTSGDSGASSGDYEEGGPVENPLVIEQRDRRLRGTDDVSVRYAPMTLATDRMPPMQDYAQRQAPMPVGAESEPPIPTPPPRRAGAVPVTSSGNRKALNDQTRTEAYDPDLDGPGNAPAAAPTPLQPQSAVPLSTPQSGDMAGNPQAGLSTNNARSDLENALHGGMTFAQHTFHLNDPNDPHHAGGKQALFTGAGAADPGLVKQLDQKVNNGVPYDAQLYNVRRLEAIHRWYSMNGETDKANKAAFELMQYSAGVAAQWGARAVDQYKQGDMPGAIKSVQEGYNHIPDGRHMDVQGNTATIVDTRTGKPVQTFQFTPEQVFNAAMGLDSRSLYWQVLGQRVSATMKGQGTKRTESQQDLDKARADYLRARTGQVGKGKAGAPGVSDAAKALIDKINAEGGGAEPPKGSAPAAPPARAAAEPDPEAEPTQQALTEEPDDGAVASDAGGKPTQADTIAPNSVLRLKPPQPGSAATPAPRAQGDVTSTGNPDAEPAIHPGYAEGVTHGPDHVPDVTVGRDGEQYVPAAKRGQPDAFSEEPPKPNPYRRYEAEAAKLPPKERAAVAQLLQRKAAAYDKEAGTYTQRRKAHETAEGKRLDAEFKVATAKQKDELKAALGYNLRPADTEAIEEKVRGAYDRALRGEAATEAAKNAGQSDADARSAGERQTAAVKQWGDAGAIKRIAYELAKMNKLPGDEALRITGELTTSFPDEPYRRTYQPRGKDVLGNIVVTTQKDGPLHIPPRVFKNIIGAVQSAGSVSLAGKQAKLAADAAPKPMDKIKEAGAAFMRAQPKTDIAGKPLTPPALERLQKISEERRRAQGLAP